MLRFNLGVHRPVFMTSSWRKSRETKSPRRRKETYCLPACLSGRCWLLLSAFFPPYLCAELKPGAHLPHSHSAFCPRWHIFLWINGHLCCSTDCNATSITKGLSLERQQVAQGEKWFATLLEFDVLKSIMEKGSFELFHVYFIWKMTTWHI